MAAGAAAAILAGMDRSLTADDFRLLDRLNRTPAPRLAAPPPALPDLPGWFRILVAEQAAWLGIPVPGAPVPGTGQVAAARVPEAA